MKYCKHPSVESVFAALRPAVVGLIASAALLLMTEENFGSLQGSPMQFAVSVLLFATAFIAAKKYRISPILIVIAAGTFGGLFYSFLG